MFPNFASFLNDLKWKDGTLPRCANTNFCNVISLVEGYWISSKQRSCSQAKKGLQKPLNKLLINGFNALIQCTKCTLYYLVLTQHREIFQVWKAFNWYSVVVARLLFKTAHCTQYMPQIHKRMRNHSFLRKGLSRSVLWKKISRLLSAKNSSTTTPVQYHRQEMMQLPSLYSGFVRTARISMQNEQTQHK